VETEFLDSLKASAGSPFHREGFDGKLLHTSISTMSRDSARRIAPIAGLPPAPSDTLVVSGLFYRRHMHNRLLTRSNIFFLSNDMSRRSGGVNADGHQPIRRDC
jgi:hypothetical protein